MDLSIVFLGTSASVPTVNSGLPALAIKRWGRVFLFDVGEGTQRQMMKARVSMMRVDVIFISHLHGDHVLGLPGLLHTMSLMQRTRPLLIVGPVGTREYVSKVLELEEIFPPYQISIKDIKYGESEAYRGNGFIVRAVYGVHSVPNLIYSFEESKRRKFNVPAAKKLGIPRKFWSPLQKGETVYFHGKEITPEMVLGEEIKGRKIVYTGDTVYCTQLVEVSRNADVIIHEATYSEEQHLRSLLWLHSTARMAGKVAQESNAKALVLTHFSPRIRDREKMAEEARKEYNGMIIAARDFMEISISPRHEISIVRRILGESEKAHS